MNPVLREFSTAALIPAIEANLLDMLTLLAHGPSAQLETTAESVRWISGIRYPLWNGIWGAQFTGDNIDSAIENALAPFKVSKMPMFWWLGPSARPVDLGAHLQSHGLADTGRLRGMAIELKDLTDSRLPTRLEIERVGDLSALDAYMRAWRMDAPVPRREAEHAFRSFAGLGFDADSMVEHYVGWLDGEPVACCTLRYAAGVVGLYNLCTSPARRGQGIGAAVVMNALRAAKRLGLQIAVLEAATRTVDFYRRLGFVEQCRVDVFAWMGGNRQEDL